MKKVNMLMTTLDVVSTLILVVILSLGILALIEEVGVWHWLAVPASYGIGVFFGGPLARRIEKGD